MAEPPPAIDHWAFFRRGAGVTILFVLLTVIMTWPQAVVLKTHAFGTRGRPRPIVTVALGGSDVDVGLGLGRLILRP